MIKVALSNLRHILTAVGLLALGLIVAEVVLRQKCGNQPRQIAYAVPTSLQRLVVPSAITHHELRRMEDVVQSSGVRFRINSLGLRGELPKSKRTNTTRILILGDETVFGANLQESHTISGRLQTLLNQTGLQAEVINGGVPGYCPALSWLQFDHELQRLAPDVVILHFDMSDVADDSVYRPQMCTEADRRICGHLSLRAKSSNPLFSSVSDVQLLRLLGASLEIDGFQALPAAEPLQRFEWTTTPRTDLRLAVEHSLEAVSNFREISAETGFRLYVSTSPVPWQVTDSTRFPDLASAVPVVWPIREDVPFRVLEAFCRRESVSFCNLLNPFREFSQPEKLFEPDSVQISAYGAALYARQLAELILRPDSAEPDVRFTN